MALANCWWHLGLPRVSPHPAFLKTGLIMINLRLDEEKTNVD